MIKYTCIFLSLIGLSSLECILDTSTARISKEVSLHEDLMRNYRNSKQATRMKNTTVSVTLKFLVKTFKFFNDEEDFLFHSWVFLLWNDDCLTWNPKDYDNIDTTLVNIRQIWTPQIDLDNELAFEYDIFSSPMQKCQVFNTGLVACIPKVTHIVTCNSVLTNWPYDTQTCSLNYTVKNNAKLTYPKATPISMLGAEYGTGWTIVAYEYTHPENLKDKMGISLTVERVADLMAAINVIPLILLAVLCVGALFIDVRSTLRVYIICFGLACDFVFVQIINENIPEGGVGTPKVFIFLRNSVLMSAIALVVTFTLKNLRKNTKPTPTWVIQINDFILEGSRRKLIWPKWEPEGGNDNIKKALEDWNTFTFVLNFFFIIVYVLTYSILFIVYIPKPIPVTI